MAQVETPAPPPRCVCGKVVFETREDAVRECMRLRLEESFYRDEYRCPRHPLGGWHIRDLKKRYEKIKNHGGPQVDELLAKIRRLDDLSQDARRAGKRKVRDRPLEAALRKLPEGRQKPVGRRGQLRRRERHHPKDDEARARGTRGTSVSNELRRKQERAKLREELLREEKDK